jgi:Kef-type K+ transport system membrane component KefB
MSIAETITLSNLELTRFFFAVVLLLIFSHFFGYIFHKYKFPRVVGEILGGVLLGPTVFGYFLPDIHNWVFNAFASEGKLLSILYWFGLVLLMFISGFEIQKQIDADESKVIIAVILGSTIIPFVAGWIAPFLYNFSAYIGSKNNILALKLVIAIAVAVTSIPIISKIFIDLKIINTRFAKVVLASATFHDVILWVALAIATGLVSAEKVSFADITLTVLTTIIFFGTMLFIMPRLVRIGNTLKINLLLKSSTIGYILFICFLFAALASLLNINIVFGAFLAGIVIGLIPGEKFQIEKDQIKAISLAFFVPLYFAIVGLKLDLVRHFDLRLLIGFLIFASTIQIGGTLIAARLIKKDWLSSFNLGIAMNARGGPGIVLATVAFDIGIINETFFVTLVLIAIITSLSAGYWFRYVLSKGLELLK